MFSPTLFPVQLTSFLLVICATDVFCIGETEINGNIHSYKISNTVESDENSGNQRHVVSVCENSLLRAHCGDGKVIRILEAHYGRLNLATCNHDYSMDWDVNCRSNISKKIMREKCDNKRECRVEASNLVFGDPCFGTIKYLEMQYMCVNVKTILEILKTEKAPEKATTPKVNKPNEKTVCEKSKMQVECEQGKVIHLIQATYGRKTLSKCNPKKNNKFNVKCASSKSDKIMREKCHRKRSCSVEATNSVFGDPCPKTEKYLEIQYRCVRVETTTKKVTAKRTTPKVTPKRTTPKRITPKATTPKRTTSKRTTPKRTTPKVTTPTGIASKATSPRGTTPKVATLIRTTTNEITSKRTTPKGTTSNGTSLKIITSKGTTIKGTTPNGTSLEIITSKGTTSEETTPNETTVKETTPKVTTLKGSTPEDNKPLSISACEHTKLNVECGNGKVIHVLRANYGRTTLSKCNPNNIKTWDVKCLSNKSEKIVKEKCDRKRSCLVEASNSVFGDPCADTMKYLEIQYMCIPEDVTKAYLSTEDTTPKGTTSEGYKPLSVSACENTKFKAECENGKVIRVIQANYGRTTLSKCNPSNIKTLNVKCMSTNSRKIMQQKCDGKRSCVVDSSNSVFGDPCSGTIKYLEMLYQCVPVETTTEILKTKMTTSKSTTLEVITPLSKYACENTKLIVECEKGRLIDILQGNYGRTTLSACNPKNIKTLNLKCYSKNSRKIMQEKCNGKRNCVIEATNSVFGDPCQDTQKYLEIQYRCIPESPISKKVIIPTSVSVGVTNAVFQSTTKSSGKASPAVSDDIPTTVSDFMTTFSNNRKTVLEISTTGHVSPTKKPDIPTSNPDIPTSNPDIPTSNPDIPTSNPDIPTSNSDIPTSNHDDDKTVLEVSTKDNFISTIVSDSKTETIIQTTIPHEKTSVPSISYTSNEPLRMTTTNSLVTDCDEQDLKCLKFKCPQDMGNFPHPVSKKFFIFCINWKPRVKACGTDLVFSEKFMTCVGEKSLFFY